MPSDKPKMPPGNPYGLGNIEEARAFQRQLQGGDLRDNNGNNGRGQGGGRGSRPFNPPPSTRSTTHPPGFPPGHARQNRDHRSGDVGPPPNPGSRDGGLATSFDQLFPGSRNPTAQNDTRGQETQGMQSARNAQMTQADQQSQTPRLSQNVQQPQAPRLVQNVQPAQYFQSIQDVAMARADQQAQIPRPIQSVQQPQAPRPIQSVQQPQAPRPIQNAQRAQAPQGIQAAQPAQTFQSTQDLHVTPASQGIQVHRSAQNVQQAQVLVSRSLATQDDTRGQITRSVQSAQDVQMARSGHQAQAPHRIQVVYPPHATQPAHASQQTRDIQMADADMQARFSRPAQNVQQAQGPRLAQAVQASQATQQARALQPGPFSIHTGNQPATSTTARRQAYVDSPPTESVRVNRAPGNVAYAQDQIHMVIYPNGRPPAIPITVARPVHVNQPAWAIEDQPSIDTVNQTSVTTQSRPSASSSNAVNVLRAPYIGFYQNDNLFDRPIRVENSSESVSSTAAPTTTATHQNATTLSQSIHAPKATTTHHDPPYIGYYQDERPAARPIRVNNPLSVRGNTIDRGSSEARVLDPAATSFQPTRYETARGLRPAAPDNANSTAAAHATPQASSSAAIPADTTMAQFGSAPNRPAMGLSTWDPGYGLASMIQQAPPAAHLTETAPPVCTCHATDSYQGLASSRFAGKNDVIINEGRFCRPPCPIHGFVDKDLEEMRVFMAAAEAANSDNEMGTS